MCRGGIAAEKIVDATRVWTKEIQRGKSFVAQGKWSLSYQLILLAGDKQCNVSSCGICQECRRVGLPV